MATSFKVVECSLEYLSVSFIFAEYMLSSTIGYNAKFRPIRVFHIATYIFVSTTYLSNSLHSQTLYKFNAADCKLYIPLKHIQDKHVGLGFCNLALRFTQG